jgi:hypothetical protein
MPEQPVSREQVEAFKRQMQMLSAPHVRDQYLQAHADCTIKSDGSVPSPTRIQTLLALWKVLWKWSESNGGKLR